MTATQAPDQLFLNAGYRSRSAATDVEDHTTVTDGIVHQPDVYPVAAHLARHHDADWIIDVGCGRAEKVMQYGEEFLVAGIDTGANIDYCRQAYDAGTWLAVDLERPGQLSLTKEQLTGSVIVCSEVIERLVDPRPLLNELARLREFVAAIVISTPDRARATGLEDLGPPSNPSHIREWNLNELEQLLSLSGLEPSFVGFTMTNDADWQKDTILAIVEGGATPPLETAPEGFRVLAVVTAFNERDIAPFTIRRLLDDGLEVIVIDNWSTDGTHEAVEAEFSGRAQILRFPEADTGTFDLATLLTHVDQIGRQSGADWIIHHDADEVREGPWPGLNLRDSIWNVQRRGFNAIDHAVIEFRPVDGEAPLAEGTDPTQALRWWEHLSHEANLVKVNAWKNAGQPVHLEDSGGHEARFASRRIHPYKFLLRHYPLRSTEHARQKIFTERASRWNAQERALGWHTHYDNATPDDDFLWSREILHLWVEETFRREFLTERLAGVGVLRDNRSEWAEQVNSPRAAIKAELRTLERERDAVRDDRDRLALNLRQATESLTAEQQHRIALERQAAQAEAALQMVLRSPSWKVTVPLRALRSLARRIRDR